MCLETDFKNRKCFLRTFSWTVKKSTETGDSLQCPSKKLFIFISLWFTLEVYPTQGAVTRGPITYPYNTTDLNCSQNYYHHQTNQSEARILQVQYNDTCLTLCITHQQFALIGIFGASGRVLHLFAKHQRDLEEEKVTISAFANQRFWIPNLEGVL